MDYSFFGTCSNDHNQFFGCLKTIVNQSILPKELIIVNSGASDIEKKILNLIKNVDIKLVYIKAKLSRVKSLNKAIDHINTKYSLRFDSRSRFSRNYAKNALKILTDKSIRVDVVGGAPSVIAEKDNYEAKLCASIMKRDYVFLYPKHRNVNFTGYSSSIYLGCFKTNLLKQIKYNDKESHLSEDSLIISKFIEKGYKPYISSKIKVSYICRSSFLNILKLFHNYGFCRGNTIILSGKVFISKRHFYVFIVFSFILVVSINFSIFSLILYPLILLLINIIGEVVSCNRNYRFWNPLYAFSCQLIWIIGFLWSFICIFKNKNKPSNFIS